MLHVLPRISADSADLALAKHSCRTVQPTEGSLLAGCSCSWVSCFLISAHVCCSTEALVLLLGCSLLQACAGG